MFLVWMLVSMLLPMAFLVFAMGLGILFVRKAEISEVTLDRVRRKNPISPYERYEPAPMTATFSTVANGSGMVPGGP